LFLHHGDGGGSKGWSGQKLLQYPKAATVDAHWHRTASIVSAPHGVPNASLCRNNWPIRRKSPSTNGLGQLAEQHVHKLIPATEYKPPRTLGTLFHACCDELQQATFAEALAPVLMFLEQALGTASETTRELILSLIDRFLRDLPPIYGARWLLAWQNNTTYC
jgi:hypothetical protein